MQPHPTPVAPILEQPADWHARLAAWLAGVGTRWADELASYPFVRNEGCVAASPRALAQVRLAVISTAGAYLPLEDAPFEESGRDLSLRAIPADIDLSLVAFPHSLGPDPAAERDPQVLLPLDHLDDLVGTGALEEVAPEVISCHGRIPDACRVVEELAPAVLREVERQGANAALIVPARRLDHQTAALLARTLESSGIVTVVPCVFREVVRSVRAPRLFHSAAEDGATLGPAGQPDEQRQLLRRALELVTRPGPIDLAMPEASQV
jgi:D-proline reductase (dithiol) PrdB